MKKIVCLRLLLLLPLAAMLCACATRGATEQSHVDTTNYQQLVNVTQESVGSGDVAGNQLRLKAVAQAALTLGAQSGLAYQAKKIDHNLLSQAEHLRTIFNFYPLILNHNILPPVLTESTNTFNLANSSTIRTSDRSFRILQNARFITVPPTWRDYLLMSFNKPNLPDKTLLPRNEQEQKAWRASLHKGWKSGVAQANQIFSQNLSRLKQNYSGMILYRKLLAEHMVTPPYVAQTDLGVTGDKSHLNIGDHVLRISALPGLQTNIHKWTPILDSQNQE